MSWFSEHQIDIDVARSLGVRWNDHEIHFPVERDNGSVFYRRRIATGQTFQPEGELLRLWWPGGRTTASCVLLCEGEGDALAAVTAISGCTGVVLGNTHVAALPGVGFPAKRVADELQSVHTKLCFVYMDGDAPGRRATRRIVAALRPAIRAVAIYPPDGMDLADCLHAAENGPSYLARLIAESYRADGELVAA